MKTCTKCQKEKPEEEFAWQKGKRRPSCKQCGREAQKAYYLKDPSKDKARVARIRDRNRAWLWNYYAEHPCVDCGEKDPIVLEPDHLDPALKLSGVSQLVHNSRSLAVIQTELDKCEIVCANCHRRRTAKTQGWFSGEISPLLDRQPVS